MLFFLKMLCDTALYYFLAAPIAGFFGSGNLIPGMLLQCAVYAVSRHFSRKWVRFLFLLPLAGCCCLYRDSVASVIVLIPAACYIVWHMLRGSGLPQLEKQREMLERCWKPIAALIVVLFLMNGINGILPIFSRTYTDALARAPVTAVSFGFLFFAGASLLLRTLRHSPQVYRQWQFQLVNIASFSIVPAIALLLGSQGAVNLYSSAIHWLYSQVILPLILMIAALPVALVTVLASLLKPLIPEPDSEESDVLFDAQEYIQEEFDAFVPAQISDLAQTALIAAAVIAAVVMLIWLFRRLNRFSGQTSQNMSDSGESRQTVKIGSKTHLLPFSPIHTVRRLYRQFLKLCKKKGLQRKESSTSQDVDMAARKIPSLREQSPPIRKLYLQARYKGTASGEDVRKMKALLAQVSKQHK